jgi:hypothetical protein
VSMLADRSSLFEGLYRSGTLRGLAEPHSQMRAGASGVLKRAVRRRIRD